MAFSVEFDFFPHDYSIVLCKSDNMSMIAKGNKEPACEHKQSKINAMIEHFKKPFLPLNDYGSDEEFASVA